MIVSSSTQRLENLLQTNTDTNVQCQTHNYPLEKVNIINKINEKKIYSIIIILCIYAPNLALGQFLYVTYKVKKI